MYALGKSALEHLGDLHLVLGVHPRVEQQTVEQVVHAMLPVARLDLRRTKLRLCRRELSGELLDATAESALLGGGVAATHTADLTARATRHCPTTSSRAARVACAAAGALDGQMLLERSVEGMGAAGSGGGKGRQAGAPTTPRLGVQHLTAAPRPRVGHVGWCVSGGVALTRGLRRIGCAGSADVGAADAEVIGNWARAGLRGIALLPWRHRRRERRPAREDSIGEQDDIGIWHSVLVDHAAAGASGGCKASGA